MTSILQWLYAKVEFLILLSENNVICRIHFSYKQHYQGKPHYSWVGVWQVAGWGPLMFYTKKFEKQANIKLKNFSKKKFQGGTSYFWRPQKWKSPLPPISNEPSLSVSCALHLLILLALQTQVCEVFLPRRLIGILSWINRKA